jgi:hypothetical protein
MRFLGFKWMRLSLGLRWLLALIVFSPYGGWAQGVGERPRAVPGNLVLHPSSLYLEQDEAVFFLYQPVAPVGQLHLVEAVLDESGNPVVRYRWDLRDDGALGDEIAGDGIYGRMVNFKERKLRNVEFFVVDSPLTQFQPQSLLSQYTVLTPVSVLELKRRPSFMEMVAQAWLKLWPSL